MEIRNLRVAIHNLGCKVNDCEAEAMRHAFTKEGAVVVPFEDAEADVCIVNTCCVTNIADRKSRQMLHRARALHPGAVIVAVGCYVQEKAAELESDSAVDILIGNNEKDISSMRYGSSPTSLLPKLPPGTHSLPARRIK